MKTVSVLFLVCLMACTAETAPGESSDGSSLGKGDHYGRTTALANAGCPAPLTRVEKEGDCLQDVACYRMEEGNEVFFCTGDDPTIPECRGDLVRVESSSGCLQDDAVCEETFRGEETYYCTGSAPLCPQGHHEVAAKSETSISRWDQDGVERFCELDDTFCDEGLERVESATGCLQDDALCIRVEAPEGTYYCTGPAPSPAAAS